MGILAKIFGGSAATVIDSVGNVVDKLTTSDKEKLDARKELAEIERKFNADLIAADVEFAKAQAEVITAEAKSESWLARNWRPILMLTFTYIIAHTFIFVPVFGIKGVEIPPEMWQLLKIGVGGYIGGRSIEKTAQTLLPLITAKINTK